MSSAQIEEKRLQDLLTSSDEIRKRYESLKEKFKSKYGSEPLFYARAPGRVNLIGK